MNWVACLGRRCKVKVWACIERSVIYDLHFAYNLRTCFLFSLSIPRLHTTAEVSRLSFHAAWDFLRRQ